MLDPQLIRNDLDRIASVLEGRGIKIDKVKIQDIENQRKSIQIETEKLQAQRNLLSKEIGDLKSKNSIECSKISKAAEAKIKKLGNELKLI